MNVRNDSRGVFHPLMVLLLVVVIAVVGFAGWKVVNKNKDNSSNATSSVNNAAIQSACSKVENDKNLCNFASHYNPKASYKAVATSTDSTNGKSSLTILTDGKDNSSLTSTSAGKETYAFISLDGATYLKDEASGSWTKFAAATDNTGVSNPAGDFKFDTNNITNNGKTTYKNLGTEACGNLTCYKYQVTDSDTPTTTQFFWFDTKNYQMQRFSFKDANSSSDMTFTYQSVKISVPSPVKDFSASTGGTGSSAAPTQAEINAAIQAAAAASANSAQ